VDGLKKALADAGRQLSAQSRTLQQQVGGKQQQQKQQQQQQQRSEDQLLAAETSLQHLAIKQERAAAVRTLGSTQLRTLQQQRDWFTAPLMFFSCSCNQPAASESQQQWGFTQSPSVIVAAVTSLQHLKQELQQEARTSASSVPQSSTVFHSNMTQVNKMTCFVTCLQWRKTLALECSLGLLDDIQLVADAPGRIDEALAAKACHMLLFVLVCYFCNVLSMAFET
jgi:hypothetical protein